MGFLGRWVGFVISWCLCVLVVEMDSKNPLCDLCASVSLWLVETELGAAGGKDLVMDRAVGADNATVVAEQPAL